MESIVLSVYWFSHIRNRMKTAELGEVQIRVYGQCGAHAVCSDHVG